MTNKYDEYLLKNAKYFMLYKKTIDKLEEHGILPVPATIGALKTISPSELLDNSFTPSEVNKLLYALKQYGLQLKDFCEPEFDPSTLDIR